VLVQAGDVVVLRDGRSVYVTDVADQDPDSYRVYDIDAYERDGSLEIKDELPVENIFVGRRLATNANEVKNAEKFTFERTGRVIWLLDTVVSNLDEVIIVD
jgi:hypothetical protein